jgi:hypothetical protein
MVHDDGAGGAVSRPVDADNHYYEPLDAFTRHLDRKLRHRAVRVVQDGSHAEMVIAGKVNNFIPNPTFDPVIVPGCLDLQFRGQIPAGVDPRSLTNVEPISPAYRDRDSGSRRWTPRASTRCCCFRRWAAASSRR